MVKNYSSESSLEVDNKGFKNCLRIAVKKIEAEKDFFENILKVKYNSSKMLERLHRTSLKIF